MHTTNYNDTFITISPDSDLTEAMVPGKAGSVAAIQHEMVTQSPYRHTSDDVIFEVYAQRNDVPQNQREAARETFFAKSKACLRASPLVKKFGWGIHHDSKGRIALYGAGTPEYRKLTSSPDLKVVAGMRSSRSSAG